MSVLGTLSESVMHVSVRQDSIASVASHFFKCEKVLVSYLTSGIVTLYVLKECEMK